MVDQSNPAQVSGPNENRDVPKLSSLEVQILAFVITTFRERGAMPILREIGEDSERSVRTAFDALRNLCAKGYLKYWANGTYSIVRDLEGEPVRAALIGAAWENAASDRDELAVENQDLKRRIDFLWRCIEAGMHVTEMAA